MLVAHFVAIACFAVTLVSTTLAGTRTHGYPIDDDRRVLIDSASDCENDGAVIFDDFKLKQDNLRTMPQSMRQEITNTR